MPKPSRSARDGRDAVVEDVRWHLPVPLVDPVQVVLAPDALNSIRIVDRFQIGVELDDGAARLEVVGGDVVAGTVAHRAPCEPTAATGKPIAEPAEVDDALRLPRVV